MLSSLNPFGSEDTQEYGSPWFNDMISDDVDDDDEDVVGGDGDDSNFNQIERQQPPPPSHNKPIDHDGTTTAAHPHSDASTFHHNHQSYNICRTDHMNRSSPIDDSGGNSNSNGDCADLHSSDDSGSLGLCPYDDIKNDESSSAAFSSFPNPSMSGSVFMDSDDENDNADTTAISTSSIPNTSINATTATTAFATATASSSTTTSNTDHLFSHRLIPTSSSLGDLNKFKTSASAPVGVSAAAAAAAAAVVEEFDTSFYDGLESIEPIDFNPFESKRVKSIFGILDGEKTLSKRVKGMIESERKKLKKSYEQRKANLQRQLAQRRKRIQQSVLEEVKKPTFIRKKDKIAFSLGIMNVVTTAFLVGRFPELIPYYYIFWTIVLLVFRFATYHMDGYHYFMLDFCYYSNLLLCFYLAYYPSSSFLFLMSFVNSNGPLLWAILAWRNSLVFHDLDKITSMFIHAFPPIVTFVLRWEPSLHEQYAVCSRPDCSVGLVEIFFPHIVFFLYWQLTYFLKTEVIDYHHLQKNPSLQTSFRWMLKTPNSAHFRLTNYFGPKYQILMFMGVQFVYHIVCILPIILMWKFFWFHAAVGAYVIWCSVWNGANFYIEKFSRDYFSKLEEISRALELEATSPIKSHTNPVSASPVPSPRTMSTTSHNPPSVAVVPSSD